MAFDGFTIASLKNEISEELMNGRIYKIVQTEPDELLITVKTQNGSKRMLISADASFPLIYLTDENKQAPQQAPAFCMLLRKHLQNGRIVSVEQPGFERVLDITIEHMDEMGDIKPRHLIAEFMGKHSNIILTDDNYIIIDSAKRIPIHVSSVREVLPGRKYFIPDSEKKADPTMVNREEFLKRIMSSDKPLYKDIYMQFTGISPEAAIEICERAKANPDTPVSFLSPDEKENLRKNFFDFMEDIKNQSFCFYIYDDGQKTKYSVYRLSNIIPTEKFRSASEMLTCFYKVKKDRVRIKQKTTDLRKLISNLSERNEKKLSIQENDLRKTQGRDKYRIYGELLRTYGYDIPERATEVIVNNFYDDNKQIKISLNPELTAQENANEYFKKYNKLKRTYDALSKQIKETLEDRRQLEAVSDALNLSSSDEDIAQVKQELIQYGYINGKSEKNKKSLPAKPMHFMSSDGFDIYVGKNNIQNDVLTFKLAAADDWWFHAKGVAGSHVILKTDGKEVPDKSFEEAAALAAHFSRASGGKAEVDYIKRKEIKKPAGAKPGFVVYYTNYSMIASDDISNIKQL